MEINQMLHNNQQKNTLFVTIKSPRYTCFITIYGVIVVNFYYLIVYDCKMENKKNNYTFKSIYAHNFQFQQIKNC
jgi:hypothetical protein